MSHDMGFIENISCTDTNSTAGVYVGDATLETGPKAWN